MSKIKQLEKSVYNKIAAGEVVERPSSVVKELVENAIDANASQIDISIQNGGLLLISVSDNGDGIEKEDLEIAFLPHATSKIANSDDIFNVSSLGFRGEALASISAVSHVILKSRYKDENTGNSITIKGNELVEIAPCGIAKGTTISVNNLFYNTPARLKFLKKPRYEENEIISLTTKFILANPNIKISLSNESGQLLSSEGKGLWSAITAVYDSELIDSLIAVNSVKGNYSVSGYISNTNYSKSNKSYQTIILNGRIVFNQTLLTAIHNCYSAYLMKRCYPVIILNINIPYEDVDVNVHPAKTEVRFVDNNKIFAILFSTIKHALENAAKNQALDFYKNNAEDSKKVAADTVIETDKTVVPMQNEETADTIIKSDIRNNIFEEISNSNYCMKESGNNLVSKMQVFYAKQQKETLLDNNTALSEEQNQFEIVDYKIVGQLFATYIIIEINNEFYIIDQHAAAERVLFERLTEEYENGEITIQPMLIPHIFSVNSYENTIITEKIEELNSIGIDIEPFGNNTFKISALPATIQNMNFELLVKNILSDSKATNFTREKLILTACKSAIKGNTALNEEGIKLLFNSLFNKQIPSSCPHGRPTYIKITKTELEKMFKRIV